MLSYLAPVVIVLAVNLVASGQQSPASSVQFDPQTARGAVIARLACLDDPTQSYALFLPSQYSPNRVWPIIYAFDPFARGKNAVDLYKDAAEKYGYIVVGSNNSKNGPPAPELAAVQEIWLDTHRRFAIDKNRVYTTGLSGGARLATEVALYCYTCSVAGVIAHGAGYPAMQNQKAPANSRFIYYAAIGDADFNYPEIITLRKKKEDLGEPCKVKVYPGRHQWAPPDVVEDSIEWLELKAMQAGTEKVDSAFVRRVFEKTSSEAAQAEQRGDVLTEYYALRSLVEDFKGLEETGQFAGKLAQLKGSKALKDAEHNQKHEIDLQASLTSTAGGELAQFGNVDDDMQTGLRQHIASVLADLRRRANSNRSDRAVYSRAFDELFVQGMEAGQDAFRENRLPQATAYFELMAEAAPDQPWPLVALAEAKVRAGDKKAALKALDQALRRGLQYAQTLTEDPELQPLASNPDFQRMVNSLSH